MDSKPGAGRFCSEPGAYSPEMAINETCCLNMCDKLDTSGHSGLILAYPLALTCTPKPHLLEAQTNRGRFRGLFRCTPKEISP